MNILAKREAVALNRMTNESQTIVFEIGEPYPIDEGASYFCPIRLAGLVDETINVGGVDTMQSIILATETLQARFEELKASYDLFWPDSEEPMDSLSYSLKDTTL